MAHQENFTGETMTRIVKGILIDPFACLVTEVEHDASTIDGIYKLLSHESHPVDCFTCVYSGVLASGDAIFVDDEGLWKMSDRFFLFPGNPLPLAGKGLVLGSRSKDGQTTDALTPLEFIQQYTRFLRVDVRIQDEATLIETCTPWVKPEEPIEGHIGSEFR
jgi:hypothetical protein